MSETTANTSESAAIAIDAPPASAMPAREALPDARQQLLKLAAELVRAGNRRLLIEYLRLRRSIR